MRKYFKTAIAAFVLGWAIAFPASGADVISITHAQGVTDVPVNPQRVITFDLASLDTLDALGVDIYGTVDFTMPENLKAYEGDQYAKLGSLFEPDFEAVNAAAPDLIIVAGRSSGAYAELSKIAPTIDLTNDWDAFIPSIKSNSRILGAIFEKSAEIEAFEAVLDAEITSMQNASAQLGDVFLVMTSGGKVSAYGPGSRLGFIHDTFGLEPTIQDVEATTHGEAISNEFILETNPSWMIVLDRDAAINSDSGSSAAQILENELVLQTDAMKNGQVVYADTARWYITNGGLTNMIAIASELSDALLGDS